MWEKVEMPEAKNYCKGKCIKTSDDSGEGKGDIEVVDLDHERPTRKEYYNGIVMETRQ
jgi:hypothetical protein